MLKWFDCDSPFAWFNLCISFHQAEPTNNAAGGEVSDDDFVPPRSPYCRRFFWPGQVLRAHIRHVPNASNSWTWASRGFHRIVRCVTRTRPPTFNGMLKCSWITCWRKKRVQKCAFLLKSASLHLIHGCIIVALIWKLWVAKHAPEKLSITLLIPTCLLPKIPINKTLHSLLQTPSPYLLLSKCSQTHNTRHAPQ